MRDRNVKNPLQKRIPRELKRDWKKYLVVALFLVLTIGFVSGMYVANGSMMLSAVEGKEKYHLENGHFELDQKADKELIRAIEAGEKADVKQFYLDQAKKERDDPDFSEVPVTVYENFYRNEDEDHDNDGNSDGTIRVYERTDDINLACLMEGGFPETEDGIATVITKKDITKMCDQLDHSMGAYMQYFQILCVLLSAVLIYLLTKLIIEKNETAISMTKILGYENREIASLYLLSTTMVVVVADAVSVILGSIVMIQAWKVMMSEYSGWFAFVIEPVGYVKMFSFVLLGYLIVMVLDFRRIRKIPMEEALKNVE